MFVDGGMSLLSALRDEVGDHSPKFGCGQGGCGACTVLIDGEPVLSCITLAATVAGMMANFAGWRTTGAGSSAFRNVGAGARPGRASASSGCKSVSVN